MVPSLLPADAQAPLALHHASLRCELAPWLGGGVSGLWVDDVPVLRCADPRHCDTADALGSYPLLPYSNRIGQGQLVWQDQTYQLQCNAHSEGHALHGIGWRRSWSVCLHEPARVVMQLRHHGDADWPFDFEAQQELVLDDTGLHLRLQLRNADHRQAPAGLGWHPYFVKRPGACVQFAAERRWDMGADMLPLGPQPHPGLDQCCDDLRVDHCFDGVQGGVSLQDELVQVRVHSDCPCLVVYTQPAMDAIAIEPVSHVNNALQWARARDVSAAGLGIVSLAPGELLERCVHIQAQLRQADT